MGNKKAVSRSDGKLMHYSVGMVVEFGNKYLLVDRLKEPLGFACPAGHIEEEETPEDAALRELREETGLMADKLELFAEKEILWNSCRTGDCHYWYLFLAEVSSPEVVLNEKEARSIGWYSAEEIARLKLEPVWIYWLKFLKIF